MQVRPKEIWPPNTVSGSCLSLFKMRDMNDLTILRYGHVYDYGGGLEQYLDDLNRTLLERSRLTIIQIQLTSEKARCGEITETIANGRLIRVSLFVDEQSHQRAVAGSTSPLGLLWGVKAWLRKRILFTSCSTDSLFAPA